MNEEILDTNQSSEKSTLAAISKKATAMKVLNYLYLDINKYGAYYTQEVADNLSINVNTAYKNLNKLVEVGLLDKVEPKGNRKEKYYVVLNRGLAEKAIEKYKRYVGFCLARLVTYQPVYASQLEQDKRFKMACEEYGFHVSEGIALILGCYKIGKTQDGTEIIVWRQEQGYDSQ